MTPVPSETPTFTAEPTDTPTELSTPTYTATETAVGETPTATATPEHHGPPHSIMLVGSTEPEAGALGVNDVPIAYVTESACLGGSGEECEGGTVVYTGTSPGFNDLTEDDPNQPLYVLPVGVEISIEITSIEAGASVMISGEVLDEVGETAVVNTTGHLHNHPTWTLVAPGGEEPVDKQIGFRLLAEGYDPAEITVTLTLFDENTDGEGHAD
jgi:hypothetical protein